MSKHIIWVRSSDPYLVQQQ